MKQLQIFLLLLFFLHSKAGIALNLHYCGGHLAEISSLFSVEGCGMEAISKKAPSPIDEVKQQSCCDDHEIVEQNDNDQRFYGEVEFSPHHFSVFTSPISSVAFVKRNTETPLSCNSPPRTELFFKKNCAFIFYG